MCHETTQIGPLIMCFHPNVKGPLFNEEFRIWFSNIYNAYDPPHNLRGVFFIHLFHFGNVSFLFMGFAISNLVPLCVLLFT